MHRKIGPFFFACITAAAVILGMTDLCCTQVLYKGKINTAKLNVRSAPDTQSSVVVVLNKGERVDVLEMKEGVGGWLTVEYQGIQGYIRNHSRYILLKPMSSNPEQKQKPAPSTPTSVPSIKIPAKGIKKNLTPKKLPGQIKPERKLLQDRSGKRTKKSKNFPGRRCRLLTDLTKLIWP